MDVHARPCDVIPPVDGQDQSGATRRIEGDGRGLSEYQIKPSGRIGGDEFIAFTIVDEPNLILNFKKNLERELEKLNSNKDKPYYIDLSVGIKELICYPNMDLKDILKEADDVLYEDKRNNKKRCIKAERA